MIHKSGGTVTLAHPKLIGDEDLVEQICTNYDIDAIEVFYPKHTAEDTDHYIEVAKKYNLMITGGSDFHGTVSRYVKELGEFVIDDQIAEQFCNQKTAGQLSRA